MFYSKHTLLAITVFFSVLSFSSQSTNQLLPIENYASLPEISMMLISPDGSRIAYRSTKERVDVLVVKDIKSGEMLGAINVSAIDPQHAYFIDNEGIILKASQYKKIQGYQGNHNVSSAFVFDLTDKELRQLLTPGFGIYKGQTNLGSLIGVSSDMKYAYMPAYIGQENAAFHEPTYELVRVSLGKKREPRNLRRGSHHAIDFFVDAEGDIIAREQYNNKTNIHLVQSYNDGKWTDIFSEETEFRTKGFSGLTPDRKSLIMSDVGANGRRNYYKMSLTDGKISAPIFTRDDADVEYVLTDIQRVVYGVRYSGFKPSYEFFNKKLTARLKAIQKAMPNNAFYIEDYAKDWSSIIFRFEGEMSEGGYLMFANGGFSYLSSQRSFISPKQVHTVQEYKYTARDGLAIPTLLTLPIATNNGDEKAPAIMMPHGGPEAYDRLGFDWLAQYFANRGFLVIQPQFRGSKGFGVDHVLKGRGEWGGKMQNDLVDAISALAKDGKIDPDKVCIVGASYGGYAALAGATLTPSIYKCAISINGISDVKEMLSDEEKDHGEDSEILSYWQAVINKQKLAEGFLDNISPINHIDKVTAPVLLIHGTRDKVVSIDQSENFFDKMEEANKQVTYLELKGEGHQLNKSESRLKVLNSIDNFLKQHMR